MGPLVRSWSDQSTYTGTKPSTADTKTIHVIPAVAKTAISPIRPYREAAVIERIRHTATLAPTARSASTTTSASARTEYPGYVITRASAAAGHRVHAVRRDGVARRLARRDRREPSRCPGATGGGAAGAGHRGQCHVPPSPTSRTAP